ncbi:unnamed protein product, partial [Phaeothamnion confervicola]
KVLCIFPSRYLFAIGLPPVFSFRWNLPPALSCNPKQLDSPKADRASGVPSTRGAVTLDGVVFQRTWPGAETGRASLDYNSGPARRPDLHVEHFPLRSPLLGESWLVSFPPLSYMLKSSGSSCLIGGATMDVRECVQSFDDSLASAIRKTYRISLCSSSLWEPRHPSLKVV